MEKKHQQNNEIEMRSIVSDLAIRAKEDDKPSCTITGYAAKMDLKKGPSEGPFKGK